MKREGFISVIALMLMTVVLTTSTYISYSVTMHSNIASNNQKSIQSRITAEDKANRLLYDSDNFEELLLPEIYKILRNNNPPYKNSDNNGDGIPDGVSISIGKDSALASNLISANMRLEGSSATLRLNPRPANFAETTTMYIILTTEYEGIKNNLEIKSKIINKIFEIKEAYISGPKMIEYDLLEEFIDLMDFIEEEIYDHDPKGTVSFSKINLENDGFINENFISEQIDLVGKKYIYTGKYNLINIIASDDKRPSWEIKSEANKKVSIKGSIYCEGDLTISCPFELEGNLILNKGSLIINTDTKPIIKGKVLDRADNEIDINKLKLNTEKRFIYKHGSYLPGFVQLKIDVIKNK